MSKRSFYIIYDEKQREPFTGRMPEANSAYIRHYNNLMELERACQVYEGLYKWQAEHELLLCQAKLAWWSKRPGFSMDVVLPQITSIKKMWQETQPRQPQPKVV